MPKEHPLTVSMSITPFRLMLAVNMGSNCFIYPLPLDALFPLTILTLLLTTALSISHASLRSHAARSRRIASTTIRLSIRTIHGEAKAALVACVPGISPARIQHFNFFIVSGLSTLNEDLRRIAPFILASDKLDFLFGFVAHGFYPLFSIILKPFSFMAS